MSLEEIKEDAELRMMGAAEAFEEKMRGVRTGRASPGLIESLKVECYGGVSPMKKIASVAAPEPRLLVVRAYDKNTIQEIMKAIAGSELGLNPQSDGRLVRIPIPPLTEERRKQLIRMAEDEAEQARVAVRNVRRDANREIDKLKKGSEASEDDCYRAKEGTQKLTDEYVSKIDSVLEAKSKEIMEV